VPIPFQCFTAEKLETVSRKIAQPFFISFELTKIHEFLQLYKLGEELDRRSLLDELFQFLARRGNLLVYPYFV